MRGDLSMPDFPRYRREEIIQRSTFPTTTIALNFQLHTPSANNASGKSTSRCVLTQGLNANFRGTATA